MHGLYAAFQATLDEGDETIFFSPYWTPIRDLVTFCGATPVLIPWEEIRRGDVSAAIEARLTSRTRVIYLNSPANPTGDVFNRAQLEAIAAIARERNIVVISDEAYEDLVHDGAHISMASLPEMFNRTISVYTLSKSYSMTGWRIGYIAAADLWMDPLKKLVLNSVNGVSTPTQFAAAAAIADRSPYLADMRAEYGARRDLLVRAAQRAGFRCTAPAGAFYLFADVRERLGGDSWKAMNELLERTSISTVPGVVFGPHGEGHLRMSYSNSMELLQQAAAALETL
jgi:aspartate aminotransferase